MDKANGTTLEHWAKKTGKKELDIERRVPGQRHLIFKHSTNKLNENTNIHWAIHWHTLAKKLIQHTIRH